MTCKMSDIDSLKFYQLKTQETYIGAWQNIDGLGKAALRHMSSAMLKSYHEASRTYQERIDAKDYAGANEVAAEYGAAIVANSAFVAKQATKMLFSEALAKKAVKDTAKNIMQGVANGTIKGIEDGVLGGRAKKAAAGVPIASSSNVRVTEPRSILAPKWTIESRVKSQLYNEGFVQNFGNISEHKLLELANNPHAHRYIDTKSNYICVIQEVNNKLMRITVLRDEFKIISFGIVKERNLNKYTTPGGRYVNLNSKTNKPNPGGS